MANHHTSFDLQEPSLQSTNNAVDEASLFRSLNFSHWAATRRGGINNGNRVALQRLPANVRASMEGGVDTNNRPQDNKEESAPPKPKTSPKPNNNLGNRINLNNTRGFQGLKPRHVRQSQHPLADNFENTNGTIMSHPLPKAEGNNSSTLIPQSTFPKSSDVEIMRYSKPTCKDTDEGLSSSNGNSNNNLPTTSKAREPSEVVSRPSGAVHESWINAPVFHPKTCINTPAHTLTGAEFDKNICKNLIESGHCNMLPYCQYTHDGDVCDMCNRKVLHPTDEEQRMRHRQECQHGSETISDQASQSAGDKSCGICFETVAEKESFDRRYGILNRCNHVFCLGCIRKWRQARSFENRVVKSCPSCRVPSEFVCPSSYWVETKEDKERLINCYKQVLANKPCKYFKQGRGECPFGNKCFYLHALPDGTRTDVGPPRRRPRPTYGVLGFDLDQMMLLEARDFDLAWLHSLTEEFEDLVAFFSDPEDSDGFDFEIIFPRD